MEEAPHSKLLTLTLFTLFILITLFTLLILCIVLTLSTLLRLLLSLLYLAISGITWLYLAVPHSSGQTRIKCVSVAVALSAKQRP